MSVSANLELRVNLCRPDLAEAFRQCRDCVPGIKFGRHAHVKNGLAPVRHLVEGGGVFPESRSKRTSRQRRILGGSILSWIVTARRLLGGGNFYRRRAWLSA